MKKFKIGHWLIVLSVVLLLLAVLLVVLITGTRHKKNTPAPEDVIPVQFNQVETEYEATEPEITEPEITEPEITEPKITEPETTAPEETGPEVTVPEEIVIGEESKEETEIQDVEIETTYATLYYPGKWKDSLRAEEAELEFGSDVKFYGTINGQEHWLFTVHFGGAEGFCIGAIMTEEGFMMDITISTSDFVPGDDWSAEATEQFNAMQEAMNYVMNKLSQMPGFEG